MYYDDCVYCDKCGNHSRDCWDWSESDDPDEEDCPGGEGHD